ncbi:MAG TPA: hypothetical protein PKG95_05180 [Anaerolineaceae bacterium]|nr:hypothetical protein [Anaerolineaceae bacterium]
MGRYTLQEDPRVDQAVAEHLAIIQAEVLRRCKPQALLLAGSFGRGEGSVAVNGTGLNFLSDYEICLISPSPAARLAVDRIQRTLAGRLPTTVSLFWNTPARIRNNRSRNLSFGPPRATIGMYELKAGSQLLYGDFDLTVSQINPASIPPSEGVRLVLNRMMEVIDAWQTGTGLGMPLAKLSLACGDALLLMAGFYHYSYSRRLLRFDATFSHFEPQLGPEFLTLYHRAAARKLNPQPGAAADFTPAEVGAVALACQRTLAILLDKLGASPAQLALRCATAVPILYCTGICPGLDPLYERLILALRARRAGQVIYWRGLPHRRPPLSPFQALYGAIPALFWGLPLADRPAELPLLKQAADWSGWILPTAAAERPAEMTAALLQIWHILG